MIYLDNAATTMRKPQEVVDAVTTAMGTLGNAGRGASSSAMGAARTIHECRERVARLLGCPRADHVAFAPNSTAALNCAINGLVGEGDRVVTTVLEHNSVLRPLNRLAAERGVLVEHVGCDEFGRLDMEELERLVVLGTRAVIVTGASNVTGNAVDVARVSRIAHAAGAVCIVDASQSAGIIPIDMVEQGLDVVCFTGHKALMGPQGTGGLAVAEGVDVRPWNVGGTGVHSFDPMQPEDWPTRLEAGTLNGHGLAGLAAGLEFLDANGGVKAMGEHEVAMARRLYEGVSDIEDVTVYGDWGTFSSDESPLRAGVLSLNVGDISSADVSDMLMQGWGIATRPGAHCAPLMHEALGTREQGVVRFSTSWFTTQEEIDTAIEAVREIAQG
ncbi:MAG: aminotransferase class V-fold PLP-dependent enzyme [Parolsenella sp.]|uniref:aminotransferase class V-fold PLP-dependent enzyme n=1 Tax=Parolsenella sp. TaxID=2083006 RepID=UPI002E766332|nr:aminotransferase class V-fold PLP-dependent enzyme [Parolsenella sp.]MEE1372207.1 aminotransferase class V-fold PLP-dependent enzyme [Parolsenella sp.]